MPKAGWIKRTFTGPRPWENTDASPFSEIPDIKRGEVRLAAEVAIAQLKGELVPTFASVRADTILMELARG